MTGRIVLLSGMPASGKTTLARAVCRSGRAVHLRVDTIESAICESQLAPESAIDAGYRVAAAQAVELKALGHDVVCDAVNADSRGRALWPRADLIVHVRVPEQVRSARLAERKTKGYAHVWQNWPIAVLDIDGTADPEETAKTLWAALENG